MDNNLNSLTGQKNTLTLDLFFNIVFIIMSSCRVDPLLCFCVLAFNVFLYVINRNSCTAICNDRKLWPLLILLVFVFAHTFPLAGGVFAGKMVSSMISSFSAVFIFDHFSQPEKRKQFVILYKFAWGLITFLSLYSIVFYIIKPASARNQHDFPLLFTGYGFATAITILTIFLLGLLLHGFFDYNKNLVTGVVALIIVMIITIYMTESTITFMILVFGLFCCFFFKKNNKKLFYFKLAIVPLLIVGLVFLLPRIGEWMIEFSESKIEVSKMYQRIYSLGHFFLYGTEDTEAAYSINRFTIPFTTLKTFLDNPLTGVAYKHGYGFLRPYLFGVGNHCEFPDALANFGIFGGSCFYSIFFVQITDILKYRIEHRSYLWLVVLFLLGFFNPLRYFYVNLVLFFLIPAFCLLNEERLNETCLSEKEDT